MEVAHEVRLAKEAEAAMDLHVAKAGQKAERELAKHNMSSSTTNTQHPEGGPAAAAAAPNAAAAGAAHPGGTTMAPPTNMPMAPPHGHGHGLI